MSRCFLADFGLSGGMCPPSQTNANIGIICPNSWDMWKKASAFKKNYTEPIKKHIPTNKKEIINLGYSQTTNFANLHEFTIGSYYSLLMLGGRTPLQASSQGILPTLKIHSCRMGIPPWKKAKLSEFVKNRTACLRKSHPDLGLVPLHDARCSPL